MERAARIVESVVIIQQAHQTKPSVEVTERSFWFDPNTSRVQEVRPTPDYINDELHQQRGGFQVDELTIGSTNPLAEWLPGGPRIPQTHLEIQFPGYNYLGPGNNGYNGPPVNEVDAAAKRHDDEYDEVLEAYANNGDREWARRELQEIDRKFLMTMLAIKPTSLWEQVGRLAGVVGIGVKKFVEDRLGYQLYPHLKDPKQVAIDYLDKHL